MLPNELADRGGMIEHRQEERSLFQGDCFSGAKDWNSCQWYVPNGEQEKAGKARVSVCVWSRGWFTKLNGVSFPFSSPTCRRKGWSCFITRNRMSLCTESVFGETHLLSNCAVDQGVILASAAKPSPARMSGALIAWLAPFKTKRYASA